ncbi:glycoside hydrolase family 32 protein [Streptococcus suis]|nr:glycoside hydrolase family 32 protein [Streptococcus suis]
MKKDLIRISLFYLPIFLILFSCRTQSSNQSKSYHLTVEDNWSNDLQTISWNEQKEYYDIYFLHSKDGAANPFGENGQDWYHTTTTDFINYSAQNRAIPSSGGDVTQGWKSAWTGSVITNSQLLFKDVPHNGKIAYISGLKKDDGSQNIWILWSEDGKTYSHVLNDGKPVLTTNLSDNQTDLRDPYVVNYKDRLLMYVAEGDVIGVYQSKDGIHWAKADEQGQSKVLASTFFRGRSWAGNAPVECPVIKTMKTTNGEEKQVLFFGAKDTTMGETTGTYYTVGHLDNNGLFVAECDTKRLDYGSDYYGANFSGSESLDEKNDFITTMGWIGNWNYSAKGVHSDQEAKSNYINHLGSYSLAREIKLNDKLAIEQNVITDKYLIDKEIKNITAANPLTQEGKPFTQIQQNGKRVNGLIYLKDLQNQKRFQLTSNEMPKGEVYVEIWQGVDYIKLMLDVETGKLRVSARSSELDNGIEGQLASSYYFDGLLGEGNGYQVSLDVSQWEKFQIDIYTDNRVIEFFFPDGQSYTVARFGNQSTQNLKVLSSENDENISLKTFINI